MQEQLDRIEAKLDLLLAKPPSLQDLFPGKSLEEINELQARRNREVLRRGYGRGNEGRPGSVSGMSCLFLT